MAATSDVVIIGAGIMGCSTASHLAERGFDVVVLEKESIGAGGTGRSSAIIRQHYSNELTARLALHSLRVFQNFDEQVGGECGFQRTGWVGLAAAEDRAGLEANVELQRRVGIQTGLLSPDELRELVPGMETSDTVAAAYEPESGIADPHLTVNAYADAARRLGARIRLDSEVTGVRFTGGKVVGVDTATDRFDAPLVLNCTGPWSARVAAMTGITIPVNSCRVQVAVFRRPRGYEAPHPVIIDFVNGIYLRPETGALSLVGSIDPSEANAVVDPDDYPEYVDSQFVSDMAEGFVRRHPPMELAESRGGYAGLYAVTPDWHPIVDETPPGSGCYVCAGFSGHGFKLGPAIGLMVADRIAGASAPEFPCDLFRLSRYAENDPVRGRYDYSIAG